LPESVTVETIRIDHCAFRPELECRRSRRQ